MSSISSLKIVSRPYVYFLPIVGGDGGLVYKGLLALSLDRALVLHSAVAVCLVARPISLVQDSCIVRLDHALHIFHTTV